MAAVDYLLSTLTSELEAEQILSIEDVFGVIQVSFASRKEGFIRGGTQLPMQTSYARHIQG